MKTVRNLLAHLCIILVVIYITLQIVEICNPHMGFLANPFATCVIWALPIAALLLAIFVVFTNDREEKEAETEKPKNEEEA